MNEPLELDSEQLIVAMGGRVLDPSVTMAHPLSELVYDSRKAVPHSVFFCIQGESSDGHDFIEQAVANGATVVVGNDQEKLVQAQRRQPTTLFVLVDDLLRSFHTLAIIYRKQFAIPLIGIAGANGKTTTKDLTAGVLQGIGPTLYPEGSLNNHWGVPQTLMKLRSQHIAAVIELGTNHFGEVRSLAAIAQPNIGYITNIGSEHLEMLGDEEGSLRANRELFDWMISETKDFKLVFNIDDARLTKLHDELSKGRREECFTVALTNKAAGLHLVDARPLGPDHFFGWGYRFDGAWGKIDGILPLPGRHNLQNALAAAALSLVSGIAKPSDVVDGLAIPRLSKFRSSVSKNSKGVVVFDDSYNANPSSFAALFEAIQDIRTQPQAGIKRVVIVVGDMLELGVESTDLHRIAGQRAAAAGIEEMIAVGEFAAAWEEGYRGHAGAGQRCSSFGTKTQAIDYLRQSLEKHPQGTMVVVKGSRGSKMDEIASALRDGGAAQ